MSKPSRRSISILADIGTKKSQNEESLHINLEDDSDSEETLVVTKLIFWEQFSTLMVSLSVEKKKHEIRERNHGK